MNILTFNCGSSSLTYKVFDSESGRDGKAILSGKAHRVGVKGTQPSFIEHRYGSETKKDVVPINNHREAAALVLDYIESQQLEIGAVGHRFVHGGSRFKKSVLIQDNVMKDLQSCIPLAPIHNPIAMDVIDETIKKIPKSAQYATFDTAFHSAIPDYAYTYPLPEKIRRMFQFRKYGFHGLSYSYVVSAASKYLNRPVGELKIVACHLGTGGSSVAAIEKGKSLDTSMGYSPLSGLVMSTRSGDMDPMLTLYLLAIYGFRSEELEQVLNKVSGLLGVSETSSDIRDLIALFDKGDKEGEQANLAFNMYVHRLKKYIGSYILVLKGVDVLIFTDDIGVQNKHVREKVCEDMEWCGINLDNEANQNAPTDRIASLNAEKSKTRILSIPTDEEIVIFREGLTLLGGQGNDSSI
ncbi:MAG TPA: acetate/propionate family kinase [Candidatus Sumerlaeota bacterium]|nr:acetate/propionate family kinase [Candidatus Sumerlaeota bacterium]HON49235.1 acetate/propionate family kinase [Candidatus Sumerlaeota bacterium]HOR64158.1 acetate/propionate family kinase [Candidatus Sumerlaeota bacterium]HPL73171.1 acetate/propionate family kinase [Candidatus Sumerlaeota bacterium]HRU54481.1 acetate/propionate family kinase [Candidatus Sumerlaeia bacterium]